MERKWDNVNVFPRKKDTNNYIVIMRCSQSSGDESNVIPFLLAKFTSMYDQGVGMMTEVQSSHSPAAITRNSTIVRGEVRAKNRLMSRTPVMSNVVCLKKKLYCIIRMYPYLSCYKIKPKMLLVDYVSIIRNWSIK